VSLFPPEDHRDPAAWAAVFAGHAWLGLALTAFGVWIGWPAWAPAVVYWIGWEVLAQRVGAGWRDAIVDGGAVALGGVTAWALWQHEAAVLAAALVATAVSVAVGMWRRL
jgi:hypothetical protein